MAKQLKENYDFVKETDLRMKKYLSRRWEIGFIKDNIEDIVEGKPLHFQMVKNPFKDRWFADPFILDVTEDKIFLLVEEMADDTQKGRIAKLTIDRHLWVITDMEILLEEPTHLSFPAIIRIAGHIFVYPENAGSGLLKLYEIKKGGADGQQEKLEYVKTICDDLLWDSTIVDLFGERKLFTAHQDDCHLDIYNWNPKEEKFEYEQSLVSKEKNMRMAGDVFTVNERNYCVNQVCNHDYGEAIEIKEFDYQCDNLTLKTVRKIKPPRKMFLACGLHTLNVYNGLVVVDFHMWNTIFGCIVGNMVYLKKRIKSWVK